MSNPENTKTKKVIKFNKRLFSRLSALQFFQNFLKSKTMVKNGKCTKIT